MPESVAFPLLIVAALIVADLLLAGGAMTMGCASAVGALVGHPIGWAVVALAVIAVLAIGVVPWG